MTQKVTSKKVCSACRWGGPTVEKVDKDFGEIK